MLHAVLAVISLLTSATLAISERDAGVHDWHLALVGRPSSDHGRAPRFHYPSGRDEASASSLVYTVTERNVLAAIEPRAGGIVWRHVFPQQDQILRYLLHGQNILALSGPGAADIRLYSAHSGHLIWHLPQHNPSQGLLPEPGSIAADAIFLVDESDQRADVVSLANGKDIRRIDGKTGNVKWKYSLDLPDEPTTQIHAIIPPAQNRDYLLLLLIKRSPGAYTLATQTLSLASGAALDKPTAIKGVSLESLFSIRVFPPLPGTKESRLSYIDKSGDIRTVFFFNDGESEPIISTNKALGSKFSQLKSVHLEEKGLFVAIKADGTSGIMVAGSDGRAVMLHQWTDSPEHALYSGIADRTNNAHITRWHYSNVLGLASMSTWTQDRTEHTEAGIVFGATFQYSAAKSGPMIHATAEMAPRTSPNLLSRMMVTTSSGALQGWLAGGLQFSREEGLAHLASGPKGINSIAFLPITGGKVGAETKPGLDFSSFTLSTSPLEVYNALFRFTGDALRSLGLTTPVKALSATVGRDWLSDAFGYRKLVFIGTQFGKLYAMDLGNGGRILWDNYLVQQSESPTDGGFMEVEWKKIAVFDKRTDGKVLLVAFVQVRDWQNNVQTVAFYVNGLTGASFNKGISQQRLTDQAVSDVIVLHGSDDPKILLVEEQSNLIRMVTPPSSMISRKSEASTVSQISIATLRHIHGVEGLHALIGSRDISKPIQAESAWRFAIAHGQRLVSTTRQTNGRLASAGRVLGDRSTLYKYINPHMLALTTADDATAALSIYLIDVITGTVVWTASHTNVDTSAGAPITLTENWLVYTFADAASDGKQSVMVSVELFEAHSSRKLLDDQVSSLNTPLTRAISRAFVFPRRVTSLSTSQTVHGISMKALLVSTSAGQVAAIPRRFLDPRRPLGKPTKQDGEEMLVPYDPVLPVDTKWILTHRYPVEGIAGMLTSNTILESTSQILVFGLDLFGGSISPSGRFDVLSQDFNKLQLIATTLGLLGVIAVLRPMVQRKQLRERWYPAS